MPVANLSLESLKKLTVPQLKALCKERQISGYSKLSKAALIQKIQESNCVGEALSSTLELVNTPSTGDRNDAALPQSPRGIIPSITKDLPLNDDTQESGRAPNHLNVSEISTLKKNATIAETTLSAPSCSPAQSHASSNPRPLVVIKDARARSSSKRLAADSDSSDCSSDPKRCKIAHIIPQPRTTTATAPGLISSKLDLVSGTTSQHQEKSKTVKTVVATIPDTHSLSPMLPLQPPTKSRLKVITDGIASKPPQGKRFKALAVRRPNLPATPVDEPRYPPSIRPRAVQFPVTLVPITLPPKKSNRKHVNLYALICSYLDTGSLRQCSLAARALRYAAYLSASYTLKREYSGTRLDALTKKYSPLTSNMWPYLRARQEERAQRIAEFDASFLGRCIPRHSVGDLLWASPNDTEQIEIVCRFLMTRLWFTLSLGGTQNTLDWSVVGAKEVVPAEIWSITLQYRCSRIEKLLVLASTCEVIGSSDTDTGAAPRVDWNTYIAAQRALGTNCKPGLLDHLSWPNQEEYDTGISKAWLKRIKNEGELGTLKRLVAERYLFASLMANSISGKYMSSREMDQELSGRPSVGYCSSRSSRKSHLVNLFLPTHHHIESVHFTTTRGVHLHPAVAVVQTPNREYYILRGNGMQIGCEEDGVADVWKSVIGCTSLGASA